MLCQALVEGLVRPVCGSLRAVVDAASAAGDPTASIAVLAIWRRASEPVTKSQVLVIRAENRSNERIVTT